MSASYRSQAACAQWTFARHSHLGHLGSHGRGVAALLALGRLRGRCGRRRRVLRSLLLDSFRGWVAAGLAAGRRLHLVRLLWLLLLLLTLLLLMLLLLTLLLLLLVPLLQLPQLLLLLLLPLLPLLPAAALPCGRRRCILCCSGGGGARAGRDRCLRGAGCIRCWCRLRCWPLCSGGLRGSSRSTV